MRRKTKCKQVECDHRTPAAHAHGQRAVFVNTIGAQVPAQVINSIVERPLPRGHEYALAAAHYTNNATGSPGARSLAATTPSGFFAGRPSQETKENGRGQRAPIKDETATKRI